MSRAGRPVGIWAAAVVAGLAVLAVLLGACTATVAGNHASGTQSGLTSGSTRSTVPTSRAASATSGSRHDQAGRAVHIRMLEDDTYGPPTYGVGMPIVVYFSARITEARDFVKATKVTVNGAASQGFWYFEDSSQNAGYPIQASFIPYTANPPGYAAGIRTLWPADSDIELTMNTKGVSAGPGFAFDDNLTLRMHIGDAHITTVDCASGAEKMVSTDNGAPWRTAPVSCGSAEHPTYTGIKVVMQKGETDPGTGALRPEGGVMMRGPGYASVVKYSARLTNSGEYVHDAPWNAGNIGTRSTSHGCTNLNPADAIAFYNWAIVGDVVIHSNTGAGRMPSWDGFGTHNVTLSQLRSGGLVPTS